MLKNSSRLLICIFPLMWEFPKLNHNQKEQKQSCPQLFCNCLIISQDVLKSSHNISQGLTIDNIGTIRILVKHLRTFCLNRTFWFLIIANSIFGNPLWETWWNSPRKYTPESKSEAILREVDLLLWCTLNTISYIRIKLHIGCLNDFWTLREMCPYSKFFWSVFSQNVGKYEPEKLRIQAISTQWNLPLPNTFWVTAEWREIVRHRIASKMCVKRV